MEMVIEKKKVMGCTMGKQSEKEEKNEKEGPLLVKADSCGRPCFLPKCYPAALLPACHCSSVTLWAMRDDVHELKVSAESHAARVLGFGV
jgi:hypothetical protein